MEQSNEINLDEIQQMIAMLKQLQNSIQYVNTVRHVSKMQQLKDSLITGMNTFLKNQERKYGAEDRAADIRKEYEENIELIKGVYESDIALYKEKIIKDESREEKYSIQAAQEKLKLQDKKIELKKLQKDIQSIETDSEYKQYEGKIEQLENQILLASQRGDEQVHDEYCEQLETLLHQRDKLFGNKKERLADLKRGIEESKQKINMSKDLLKTVRKKIEKSQAEINRMEDTTRKAMTLQDKKQDKGLKQVDKKSRFFRILDNVMSKIGGKKKFDKDVMQPVTEQLTLLKAGVPTLISNVVEKINLVGGSIDERRVEQMAGEFARGEKDVTKYVQQMSATKPEYTIEVVQNPLIERQRDRTNENTKGDVGELQPELG